jgi:hypothetical protein
MAWLSQDAHKIQLSHKTISRRAWFSTHFETLGEVYMSTFCMSWVHDDMKNIGRYSRLAWGVPAFRNIGTHVVPEHFFNRPVSPPPPPIGQLLSITEWQAWRCTIPYSLIHSCYFSFQAIKSLASGIESLKTEMVQVSAVTKAIERLPPRTKQEVSTICKLTFLRDGWTLVYLNRKSSFSTF